MNSVRGVLLAVGILLVAACGQVHTNVEAYSTMDDGYRNRSVAVAPYPEQEGSLEFASHARKLEAKLAAAGMRVVPFDPDGQAPDYVAFIDFFIDNGTRVPYAYTSPVMGTTRVPVTTLTPIGNSGLYSTSTSYTSKYGVTGYETVTGARTEFARELYLDIMQVRPDGEVVQVYESRLTSSGRCGNLGQLMDSLLTAMFQDFPRPASGEVVTAMQGEC